MRIGARSAPGLDEESNERRAIMSRGRNPTRNRTGRANKSSRAAGTARQQDKIVHP